ncbi:hypothetical protein KIF24_31395 [Micromonospora sp. Llam7]|uniref:hypothetical protein n=1 Tax=Micromonospora tarapacensis TaxID=2835305 RepID=UPI001C8310FB|nr:hypothetical protein [Micromonospora tarapacensis]MBX7270087.1 hypothetical protein [Micromonospora tarapacensis]
MFTPSARRNVSALALTLLLTGCANQAAPVQAEPTPPTYQLVDDLCERLDHSWMIDLAETPPRYRSIPSLPAGKDHRRCFATAFDKDRRTLIQVQIDTSTPSDGQATLPGSSQPFDGLGDQARIQFGEPVTGPSEHLGGQITTRIDRLAAVHGTAKVWVTLTVHAPAVPEKTATEAVLNDYGNEILTFMAAVQ